MDGSLRCLSTYANDFFDIRMVVVDKTHVQTLAGGYEIRRKDWAEVPHLFQSRILGRPNRPHRTSRLVPPQRLYSDGPAQENIPLPFRSTVGVCRLLHALLSSSGPVQHIFFPPHHQDPPDAAPRCKGFALVTLNEPDLASHLLSRFPYDRDKVPMPTEDVYGVSSVKELEARKQASARSRKSTGIRCKRNMRNTARTSCTASPPVLKLRHPITLTACTAALLASRSPHSHRTGAHARTCTCARTRAHARTCARARTCTCTRTCRKNTPAAVVPVHLRAIRAARTPRHEQNCAARVLFRPAHGRRCV